LDDWIVAGVALRAALPVPGDACSVDEAEQLNLVSSSRDPDDRSVRIFERELERPFAGMLAPIARVRVVRFADGTWEASEVRVHDRCP
jgi:hypothetical protein